MMRLLLLALACCGLLGASAQDIFDANVFPSHPDVRVSSHILSAALDAADDQAVPIRVGANFSVSLGMQNLAIAHKAGFRGWAVRLVSDTDSSQVLLHQGADVEGGVIVCPPGAEITFAFSFPVENVLPRNARIIGVAVYGLDAGDDGMSTHTATFLNRTATLYESLSTKERIEEGVLAGAAMLVVSSVFVYYALNAFGFNAEKGGVLGYLTRK